MKKYHLVSVLWLISSMNGQNLVDLRTQTKNVNFSGAASTIPAQTGTTLPATCTPGQLFFNTGSTPGQNLYACAPANTWTVLGGSSGSGTKGTISGAGTLVGHVTAGLGDIFTNTTITSHNTTITETESYNINGDAGETG